MLAAFISFFKVILIDLVMSGDNAIIIALSTKKLDKKIRKKAMYIGIAIAAIIRICLAAVAIYLLQYPAVQTVGGYLLLLIAWNLFRTLKLGPNTKDIKAHNSFRSAIGVIVLADFSLSLDNIVAVASIAKNLWILAIGLLASISMMLFAATKIMKIMKKHERIERFGLVVIVHTAIHILFGSSWSFDILGVPFVILSLVALLLIFTHMYISNVTHVQFHMRQHHLHNNTRLILLGIAFTGLVGTFFSPIVYEWVVHHTVIRTTILILAYIAFLELVMQQRTIDHHDMIHQSKH